MSPCWRTKAGSAAWLRRRVEPVRDVRASPSWVSPPRLIVRGPFDVEAATLAIVDLQEAYAKARLIDREALREAQEFGDALYAYEVLLDAYKSDVRRRVRRGAGRVRRGRGSDRRAAAVRLRGARMTLCGSGSPSRRVSSRPCRCGGGAARR